MAVIATLVGAAVSTSAPEPLSAPAAVAAEDGICPPGYLTYGDFLARERAIAGVRTDAASDLRGGALALLGDAIDRGVVPAPDGCVAERHPEPYAELLLRAQDWAIPRLAPTGSVSADAFPAAVAQRDAMVERAASDPPAGVAGVATKYGEGPLRADDPRFGTSSLGLVDNAGRVDDLDLDPATGRLFAAVGTGGVWMSEDRGDTWSSIGDNLPTTVVASVAWSSAAGGTLTAITGDPTFGGISGTPGLGAYYTRDFGATWTRSAGVPNGGLGFRVAVDPSDPTIVYVATQFGLFRSADASETFTNVVLPTGDCAGVTDTQARPDCQLANIVTDVVVQELGGTSNVTEPKVVAAVGWRGGNRANSDGTIQSPNNGIYTSTRGEPGTWAKTGSGFTPQNQIGRIELGAAGGPDQNHGYLYAMVQDAAALNDASCAVLDAPGDCSTLVSGDNPAGVGTGINTVLDGIFVSSNFGESWTKIAGVEEFQSPTSGSALNGTASALGYQPGVQTWYNQFVGVDPTRADPITGAPTRLILGMEEVWQNEVPNAPVTQPNTTFKVIGRYFSGSTCLFLNLGTPVCPVSRPDDEVQTNTTTTHPDQQSVLLVPSDDGVTLYVGNDGGVYKQAVANGEEFDNGGWGDGINQGFQTLLPYHAVMARDGRAWFGLQDNGSGYVDPTDAFQQFQAFGGDGFFVAVDPDNSNVAYYETPGANMSVTSDGGLSSAGVRPPPEGGPYNFSNQFDMDNTAALHLVTAGSRVYETVFGPGTTTDTWAEVFGLGTANNPGDVEASGEAGDPLNKMSSIAVERDAVYVAYCGVCDILNSSEKFKSGLATNVRFGKPQHRATSDGWHVASANGLPNRYVTNIEIDPRDVDTVYVTMGGYSRKWASPGTLQDDNDDIGVGHVFKSVDAGENFVDISGELPDAPFTWVELRGSQLIVGSDLGVFISAPDGSPSWTPMPGLPNVPIATIEQKPGDPDTLVIATFGRGVWTYTFTDAAPFQDEVRIAGADRIATAVQTSRFQWKAGEARSVTIATADDYADALAGVPLAWQEDGPILLARKGGVPSATLGEIVRLGVVRVQILGGETALTAAVEQDLRNIGVTDITRIGGRDRFETAQKIAAKLPNRDIAYIVEGRDADPSRGWPDALSVAPLAAYQGRPILLVTTESVPQATRDALGTFGFEGVTVIGGEVAVSAEVRQEIEDMGLAVKGIAGADRYETSTLLADTAIAAGLTEQRIWLATGANYPDALAAGPSIVANGGLLLLSRPSGLAPVTKEFIGLNSLHIEHSYFLGGTAVLADQVMADVDATITAGPPPPPVLNPIVGETLAEFGFETGDDGWVVSGGGDAVTGWRVAAPGDASGQSFQVAPYNNEATYVLTSPAVAHPGGTVRLTFSEKYNTEECCDFFVVEWSSDGQIFSGLKGIDGLNPSYPAFDQAVLEFVAPPGDVYVRFKVSADQLVNGEGAYVDNVKLER